MGSDWQRAKRNNHGLGNWKLVRYADDFVVMVSGQRGHAEALREEVAAVLAPMGLRLSPEKTRVVHIDEGFDFLGFHIRRRRKRGTQRQCVYTTPSKRAVAAVKARVRHKSRRSTLHMSPAELITSINRTLRGWATYFRHGVSARIFQQLDNHAWWRIVGWLRAKYQGKSRIGMREVRRRFCQQGWRLAHEGVAFTGASSVAVTRYRYRGSTIATPWATTPIAATSG
jgi:RNA-directed DNA polymerase